MAVPIEAEGDRWLSGPPVRLFNGPYFIREQELGRQYDVTSDGQRFLMIRDAPAAGTAPRIVLVQNWAEELAALSRP